MVNVEIYMEEIIIKDNSYSSSKMADITIIFLNFTSITHANSGAAYLLGLKRVCFRSE